jgi:hypothetical protein
MSACLAGEDSRQGVALLVRRTGVQINCGAPLHLGHRARRVHGKCDVESVGWDSTKAARIDMPRIRTVHSPVAGGLPSRTVRKAIEIQEKFAKKPCV